MGEGIEAAFGNDWLQKYKDALANTRNKRLEVTGAIKEEIINLVKKQLNPEAPRLTYMNEGRPYHVILGETLREINPRPLKYGISVSIRSGPDWYGAIINQEQLDGLVAETPYVFVGFVKEREYNGRKYLNMNVHGMITMDEIANTGEAKQAEQSKETDDSLAEYREVEEKKE